MTFPWKTTKLLTTTHYISMLRQMDVLGYVIVFIIIVALLDHQTPTNLEIVYYNCFSTNPIQVDNPEGWQ